MRDELMRPLSKTASFFASTAKPTVDEFMADPRDLRRGRLAAIMLYHCADYWHEETKTHASIVPLYKALIDICPDFQIVRDVADASKHDRLRVQRDVPRLLSGSEQLTKPEGLFNAPFGSGVFAEASIVIFTLDDGTRRPLVGAIQSVLSMWEALLHQA